MIPRAESVGVPHARHCLAPGRALSRFSQVVLHPQEQTTPGPALADPASLRDGYLVNRDSRADGAPALPTACTGKPNASHLTCGLASGFA